MIKSRSAVTTWRYDKNDDKHYESCSENADALIEVSSDGKGRRDLVKIEIDGAYTYVDGYELIAAIDAVIKAAHESRVAYAPAGVKYKKHYNDF